MTNLNNSTLNTLLKDYERKRELANLNFEKQKSNFYHLHPELADLKYKLGKLALDISKAVLHGDSELEKKLKIEFNKLTSEKENLLKTISIPPGALAPLYECNICEDTGFTKYDNGKSTLCNCIKQKLFDIDFNKSNIRKFT